jgi:bifunctional DNA-binding transcriptional regulator/antitoxin component of YhaV-PrlF toxin-antitoxin module
MGITGGDRRSGRERGRGQVTIPAPLRKELRLDEEMTLNVVKVGDALILTPKKLIGDTLAKKARKEMKRAGLGLDDLLKDLEKQRERYNRERYGG